MPITHVGQLETRRLYLEPDRTRSTPYLEIDLDMVAARYRALQDVLPTAAIHYAVKANSAPQVLAVLAELGAGFDCASIHEIEQILDLGVSPSRISYGNTIKKAVDIEAAYRHGVMLYGFDCAAELAKLAQAAPGAQVYCRILADGVGADWPLSRKFGCAPATAADLLLQARTLGLQPVGISFHVGSQQRDPSRWDDAIATVGKLFAQLAAAGLPLELINLGGGLPARHRGRTPALSAYAAAITTAVAAYFPRAPRMIVEPGRSIVGDAGTIVAEVVLISHKEHGDERRWVYLDIGKFGGLPETADEAIRYRMTTSREGGPEGPVVIAGPTCDSMDVLYERADYRMPLDLQIGDRVLIHGTGAYTASYCSVGFNGFPPLKSWFVGTGA